MISVEIKINNRIMHNVFSENITESHEGNYGIGEQTYTFGIINDEYSQSYIRTDKIIKHDFNKGAIELSIKMLQELLKQENQEQDKLFKEITDKFINA